MNQMLMFFCANTTVVFIVRRLKQGTIITCLNDGVSRKITPATSRAALAEIAVIRAKAQAIGGVINRTEVWPDLFSWHS